MNRAKKFLVDTAERFELPADVLAGVPKMEISGFREFSIEPHQGLLEYERERISIKSDLGRIHVIGRDLSIKLMNCHRITIKGDLISVDLQEGKRV